MQKYYPAVLSYYFFYCSDLEDDLHKRIRLKEKRGVKETYPDDEGDKGVEKDC